MAKEVAIEKRSRISQAQQNMILAVAGTGVILGVCLAVIVYFINLIGFNSRVISAKDEAIVAYSDTLKNVGICKAPKDKVYSLEELKRCNPDTVSPDSVPGTLRANVLNILAYDDALGVVAKTNNSRCIDDNGKPFTLEFLKENYDNVKESNDADKIASAVGLIKQCSGLRLIPDALPSKKNEEALLSSLNKIFVISDWIPESLTPSSSTSSYKMEGLNSIMVNLSLDSDAEKVYTVLNNIEHSIREFNIERATIETSVKEDGSITLNLRGQASAYWASPASLKEVNKRIEVNPDTSSKKGKK